MTWTELAAGLDSPITGTSDFAATQPTFPFGAHVAVVEVDIDTGKATLQRLVGVDDAGRILNPLLAAGQVHGGMAQGAAEALLEEIHYADDGTPRTTTFADYAVISAAELPSFEVHHLETPTWVTRSVPKASASPGRSACSWPSTTRSSTPSPTSACAISHCRARRSAFLASTDHLTHERRLMTEFPRMIDPASLPDVLTDEIRDQLVSVSTATLTHQLQMRGIRSTFLSGLKPTHPELRMVGRARTLRYVALREDIRLTGPGERTGQKQVVETVEPGDVVVMEAR